MRLAKRAHSDRRSLTKLPTNPRDDHRTRHQQNNKQRARTNEQIYHHCAIGQRYDFLCPNYTLFDQTTFTCRFINTVDCDGSTKHYDRNNALYVEKDDSGGNKKQEQAAPSSSTAATTSTSTTTTTTTSTSTTSTTTQAPKLNIQMSRRFGHLSAGSGAAPLVSSLDWMTHRKSVRDSLGPSPPKSDTTIK